MYDPRVFFPRVVAELAQLRDGVEDPEPLAGLDVESADVALHVLKALRVRAGLAGGADDHDVVGDHRRGMQPDLAVHRIDDLVVVQLQVDNAVAAEARRGHARLGIERDETIAGRHVQDALLAAVGPVGETAARQLARRRRAARAFLLAVHPELLAGCRGRARRRRGGCRPSRRGRRWPSAASPSYWYSGRGPRLSVLNRQATSSLLKFVGVDLIERRVPGVARDRRRSSAIRRSSRLPDLSAVSALKKQGRRRQPAEESCKRCARSRPFSLRSRKRAREQRIIPPPRAD